jgi:hypothetical protein
VTADEERVMDRSARELLAPALSTTMPGPVGARGDFRS